MKNINSYENLIQNYRLPRTNEIPDLELYMDQVIVYVKKYFSVFPYETEQNFITPSMINNYVKSGLMPAPKGKKYSKKHIAYIITIFFLKQIFSLEEVKGFISLQIKLSSEKKAYESFCEILEAELKNCANIEIKSNKNSCSSNSLHHAAISIANKLYAQHLIMQDYTKKRP